MSNAYDMRYKRYVHRPYKRPDNYSIATPRQKFDHTRFYRVLTAYPGDDRLTDISTPIQKGDKEFVETISIVRAFYVGAEADLDRYLRWLNNVSLIDDQGEPRPLFVLEQFTSDLASELDVLKDRKSSFVILFPNQLDQIDLLIDFGSGDKKKWHAY